MRTPLVLLRYIAKALGNAIGGGIAGDLFVEVLPEVAKDVWQWWSKDRTTEQCRAEVEAVVQAGAEEVRQQAAEIVLEFIFDKPLEVRQTVETYLTQVPASIRKSLRRSSDPTGTTVPADLVPRKADDLLRLLPAKPSRFRSGDHPAFKPDWELEQLLGVGGFGEVWKARNPLMSYRPPVALKFCLDDCAAKVLRNEAAVLERVMREGKHPGIVQLLDTHLKAETPCLEYEYVDGGDLTGLIQEWHRARGGPTPHQAAKMVSQLAEVVGFAHRLKPDPIVHRDLKPANILVQRIAEGEAHFKVADFGIGGVAVGQAIRETTRGSNRGRFLTSALYGAYTPLYASPQQMRGEPADPRDDVYSLGVIWYQLLTGDLATGRPGGSRWRKKLAEQGMPSEMMELLECCFEDNPNDRPSDAVTLTEQISRLLCSDSQIPPADQKEAESHITLAMSYVERGEYDKAVEECSIAIRLDPKDARAYVTRGEAYHMKGDFYRAITDASEAIRLDPKDARAYGTRGEAYRTKCYYDQAIADASEAIRLDPRYAPAYFTRGDAYRMKGDLDRAIADFTEAIRLDPKDSRAYGTRGEAHRTKCDYDQAIAEATEAISLDPKNAGAYFLRGAAYCAKGDYDRAIADAGEAILLDPKDAWAYRIRGDAYRGKGDCDRAIADASEAIRLDPKFARAYSSRGEAYRVKGDHDRAIADFSEAIRLDPKDAFAYFTRGAAYRVKGDHDRAVADASEAIRLDPKFAFASSTRGEAYRIKGDFLAPSPAPTFQNAAPPPAKNEEARCDQRIPRMIPPHADEEARPVVQQPGWQRDLLWLGIIILGAVALFLVLLARFHYFDGESGGSRSTASGWQPARPNSTNSTQDAVSHINLATASVSRGEYDKAIEECNLAIRLDAKDARAYGTRGEAYRMRSALDRAIADASEAIRLDPKYARAYGTRGAAYHAKGALDRAIADASEAIRLDPKYARAYGARGAAYHAKGDYGQAIADLTEALRLHPEYAWAKKQLEMARRTAAVSGGSGSKTTSNPRKYLEYTKGFNAEECDRLWNQDRAAFAKLYDGKVLELYAVIHSVVVTSGGCRLWLQDRQERRLGIFCEFSKVQEVRPGQAVTLRGRFQSSTGSLRGCQW
jgi:tetratricopeptide (TPR) repeat protein